MERQEYRIHGIKTAEHAEEIAAKIRQTEGIDEAEIDWENEKLQIVYHDREYLEAEQYLIAMIEEEPEISLSYAVELHHHAHHDHHGHHHDHEDHSHEHEEHEHHHEHEHAHEHEEKATYRFSIKDIDCADCAAKLERKISQIEGLENVSLNYMAETLVYDCDHDLGKEMEQKVRELIAKEEPDAVLTSKGHSHHHHEHAHEHENHAHEHEEHSHDHHHEHEHGHDHEEKATYRFSIKDIDCADCAAKLERKIAQIEGLENVSLNFMGETLVYDCDHDLGKEMEQKVRELIAKEEPDAVLTSKGHSHHHHEHHHEHEHNHEHEEKATYRFSIKDIDCADCAAKLERKIAGIEGLENVSLNFMAETLVFDCDHDLGKEMEQKVRELIAKEEPDAVLTSKGHSHHHEHEHACSCEAHEEQPAVMTDRSVKYSITGLDCADCAAKLEGKLQGIKGISNVHISFLNSTLIYDCAPEDRDRILQEAKDITAKEEPEAVIAAFESAKKIAPEEEDDDSKVMLYRLIAGAVLFAAGLLLKGQMKSVVMILSYLVLGYDVLWKAVKGIGRGQLFDEHFLMSVATLAAMYLKDFSEAAGVMLFYQIGEYFQDLAVARSRRSIGALMDIRPDHALVSRNGGWVSVSPEEVRTGEIIQVRPGEKIPLDGIIVKGASSLDTAGLTGESEPRDVDVNDTVYSGTVNINGVLEIRTVKEYGESTVSKILDLVENQESRKSSHENFITRFSRVYTPTVVFAAVAVAILTGILTHDFHEGIYRACTFLVISCPCALVISIPLSFFAGIGGLSSRGVLVKGANLIEPLAKTDIVVFDKTGTLTSGVFAVEETLHAEDKDKLLEDAAYAEYYSNHPIAAGIRAAYGKEIDPDRIQNAAEIAGRGLSAELDGRKILAGNLKLMNENGIECPQEETAGTLVYVASEGKYEGCLVLRDQIREDTESAVKELQAAGKKCMIISGDHQAVTDMIAQKIGADGAYGDCLPQDKVSHVTELMKTGNTAFVGDGVNDAPVLATADTGIAMGGMGSDAAIECADVVIMDDKTSKVALAVKAAQRILRVANQNIYGAICIKILTLILGAFGIANMWMAIFADTGVAMLCVINAMRLLRIGRV